jgi:enoyl-CoA hydratase
MSNDLLVETDGDICRITMNRPDAGNALTDAMVVSLAQALDTASTKAQLVMLRGAGAEFCTGRSPTGTDPSRPDAYLRRSRNDIVFECFAAYRRCKAPVLGVVQGKARGIGVALSTLCDVTIASDAATFHIPELPNKILPTIIMSALVDRIAAKGIAWLVYSASPVNAARAQGLGIVSEVVPAAMLEESVKSFCTTLLTVPRPSTEGVKEYLRAAPEMGATGGAELARNLHAIVHSSADMRW